MYGPPFFLSFEMNFLPAVVAKSFAIAVVVAMSTAPVTGVGVRSVMTCVIIGDLTFLSTLSGYRMVITINLVCTFPPLP